MVNNSQFSNFHFLDVDFSLAEFMADNSVASPSLITGLVLERLKETLGLSKHMDLPGCSLTDPKYALNTNGIKNGELFIT